MVLRSRSEPDSPPDVGQVRGSPHPDADPTTTAYTPFGTSLDRTPKAPAPGPPRQAHLIGSRATERSGNDLVVRCTASRSARWDCGEATTERGSPGQCSRRRSQ